MQEEVILAELWRDYTSSTPQALRIRELLAARGETIQNDHVALRTYALPGIDMRVLAQPFEAAGWTLAADVYPFPDKHLVARYWRPPSAELPKVFISELDVEALSPAARVIVHALHAQVGEFVVLPWAGRPWRIAYADYEALLAESEYAAWVAAFGFRVNHFTVLVNALSTFVDLQGLVAFLQQMGETLSTAGGVIKGSPFDLLEQASTRADSVEVSFADTSARIPSCYYEFARRYPMEDGSLFQGFVPASADRIFESTNVDKTLEPRGGGE
ncbi:MAG TPA: DUF1338 domain-containing protein [Kofleriaceae bacterium]